MGILGVSPPRCGAVHGDTCVGSPAVGCRGGLTPKPLVVSSLGCCLQQQSEQQSVSAPCQRERTASDLACPLNTSVGERAAAPAPGSVGFAGFGLQAPGRANRGCQMEAGNRIPTAPGLPSPSQRPGSRSWDQLPGRCLASALYPLHPARGHGERGDIGDTQGVTAVGGWGMQGYAWGTSCPGEGGLGAGSPWGAWGASFQACGWMGPSAAPNLLDFPEKIKPGAGRVRQPPSSARHFTWAGRGAATENGKNRFEPLKSLFGVQ